jgi:hypothetical protein
MLGGHGDLANGQIWLECHRWRSKFILLPQEIGLWFQTEGCWVDCMKA